MKNIFILFIVIAVGVSCKTKQKTAKGNAAAVSPDKTLTVQFYPYWGGSAEAMLERKNGKDNLYSTYHEKIHGVDTVLTTNTAIEKSMADSIFNVAEKVKWNADANYGTASGHEGLKVFINLRKGHNEQSVSWEKLKDVNDLPPDILNLVQLINSVCPDDFKLF